MTSGLFGPGWFESEMDIGAGSTNAAASVTEITADHVHQAARARRSRSKSRAAEAQGREMAGAFARLMAALAFARGVLRVGFTSRQQAEAYRARLVAMMEPLLELAARDLPLLDMVGKAYGTALDALDAQILTLKPIARVATGGQPACLVAWQLYGDTERAAEIVRLNGVRCPEFMPETVLAPLPDDAPRGAGR